MNRLIDGTTWRNTAAGIVAVRGKREIYFLGTSVAAMETAREMLASKSFNTLFNAGTKHPTTRNTVYLKMV